VTALAIAAAVLIVAVFWLYDLHRTKTKLLDAIATLQGNARLHGETNAQLRRRLNLRRVPRRDQ
jgi:hypothetical protein